MINAVALVASMLQIIRPEQVILQINSFIISKWNPLYFAIATPLISFATLFAFFLPLYPIMVYTLTVLTWVTQYIEALLAMPIILLGMANPEGHSPLLGKADKAIMLLVVLFVRPFTTLMGFVIGCLVTSIAAFMFYNLMIPLLDMQIGSWAQGYATLVLGGTVGATKVLDTTDVTLQAVMTMIALTMFTMIFYYMIMNAYSLIYRLPNSISAWIGIQAGSTSEEEILQEVSGQVNNIAGSLAGASTQIAGKQGQASAAGSGLDFHGQYGKGKQTYKGDMEAGKDRRKWRGDS
jgi:defect-in-organelle-trafficking protein DotA